MKYNCIFVALILISLSVQVSFAQDKTDTDTSSTTLKKMLKENSYPLLHEKRELGGEGGAWLQKRADEATIITIGEMHATKEIPAIITSLIKDLQQADEFDYLALEVSPWTAEQMTNNLRKGKEAYNSLIKAYPYGIPFYNFENERDLVHQVVRNSKYQQPLWGLDQIFAFSTAMAFDRLKELAPSDAASSAVTNTASAGATKSADDPRLQNLPDEIPTPLTVFDSSTFNSLQNHFTGIEEAQQILNELAMSSKIYRLNDDNNYRSNQMRAEYIRDNFRQYVDEARDKSDDNPQIVIKTGARHAYKGMTPNNALDVGNLSVSLARAMGGEAFNIAFLCGPGSQNKTFPAQTVDCSSGILGDDFKSLAQEHATVFDLRALHRLLHNGTISAEGELKEFLWGFDAVVIVPNASPAEPISASKE